MSAIIIKVRDGDIPLSLLEIFSGGAIQINYPGNVSLEELEELAAFGYEIVDDSTSRVVSTVKTFSNAAPKDGATLLVGPFENVSDDHDSVSDNGMEVEDEEF